MSRSPHPHYFRQRGFTLMELLVVLVILGFVIAMVAPRLAGIGSEALATVTRTNMAALIGLVTADLQKNGKYPTGMINIVSVDKNTGAYHKPMVSDQDPETGYEVLGHRMDQRHRLHIHHLSEAEASELRGRGVLHVYNYNSPYDRNVATRSPNMQPVAANVAVLMTGGGDNATGSITADLTEQDRDHPETLFRMVFGLGSETSLIKNGQVHGAPTCPESGQDPINYEWKWYSLLLPRLKATAQRLRLDNPLGTSSNGTITAYAAEGVLPGAALTTAARRTLDAYEAQHPAFFAILDSEGLIHPSVDMTGWGIDFNADGDIN